MFAARTAVRVVAPAGARSFSSTPTQMATLRELESRIKSVGNIGTFPRRKITKSMKMVAASRLARAQNSMRLAKAYGQANNAVFEQSEAAKSEAKVEKILYIAVSSDRGLCGGIHSSIAKATKRDIETGEGAGKEVTIVALGEKPKQQLARGTHSHEMALSFSQIGKAVPTFADALAIADKIESEHLEFDKVRPYRVGATLIKIVYNKFLTVISYEAAFIEIYSNKALSLSPAFSAYEVESDELGGDLSSFAMANAIYAGLVEGFAAEKHSKLIAFGSLQISARRNAMENASKNAEEMIAKLRMQFNRMRQAAITNELVDIITGASAL
ncbi:BQ5605_C010g05900 [Microbotryum silenes-dioicae]|uniref:ATP synthase subunit gamma n=1 Tax=Microbotryum silenes-dioicae TaxID=796604 RepID=A0A2X0LPY8_9BASI|nr:BQ5605_C010g05900 [Microbotryum silenes-dioicae]